MKNKISTTKAFLLALCFAFPFVTFSQDGSLDNTFGVNGIVTTFFGSGDNYANATAIQADGKIVLAGASFNSNGSPCFALTRYNTNGSLDNSFCNSGIVTTSFGSGESYANDMAIQTDGKIVVAGESDNSTNSSQPRFTLTRYNTNGNLDNTFGTAGIVITAVGAASGAGSVAIQTDGKIVAAGGAAAMSNGSDFVVVRYNNSLTGDISEYSNISSQISIYPNPFSNTTTLKTENLFENATFIVYNTLGEQVRKIDNISGQTFTFYRENLDEGIYFYHLKENNKMLSEDKLIICD